MLGYQCPPGKQTHVKMAWPSLRRCWKQHLVSLVQCRHHAGRGEICPGLSTDMFPHDKTSRKMPHKKGMTSGRSCQFMECTRTWDTAHSPVSLRQHLLAPMGLLLHDHALLWGRKPREQEQSHKPVKQRATGMIKHTFFRSPRTIQIPVILLKSVGPGT